MASNLLLIVLLLLVSLSLASGYSLSTRDAVSKQDDESYFMATGGQGSSMIDVEDLAKARSLQALVAGSKVVVNKASKSTSKSTSTKSSKKKKTHKSKNVGSLHASALVGIIIAAIVVTIVIICVLYFFYLRHKAKKAQSIGQEKINGSSKTQTSKTEDHV